MTGALTKISKPQAPETAFSSVRSLVFTENNPKTTKLVWPDYVRYAVWQLEQGKSGTKHLQGYVEFSRPIVFRTVKFLFPRAHFEKRRGTREQARDYCMKADTRVDGPWEHGKWLKGGQGRRNDLEIFDALKNGMSVREASLRYTKSWARNHVAVSKFMELHDLEPRRRHRTELHVLVGPPGSGKTELLLEIASEGYWEASDDGKWFDGYDGHEVVVFDEFDKRDIRPSLFLRLLGKSSHRVETKGGSKSFRAKRVFVAGNKSIEQIYVHASSDELKGLMRRIDSLRVFDRLASGEVQQTCTDYSVENESTPLVDKYGRKIKSVTQRIVRRNAEGKNEVVSEIDITSQFSLLNDQVSTPKKA